MVFKGILMGKIIESHHFLIRPHHGPCVPDVPVPGTVSKDDFPAPGCSVVVTHPGPDGVGNAPISVHYANTAVIQPEHAGGIAVAQS